MDLSKIVWLHVFLIVIDIYTVHCRVTGFIRICVQPGSGPEQIRIALRPPDGITVSWKSYGMKSPNGIFSYQYGFNDVLTPTIRYGTFSNMSNAVTVNGESTNYDNSSVGSWFHNVALSVLPNTTYYYQIMNSSCTVTSPIFKFKTPPVVGDTTPLNIVIFGDLGLETQYGKKTVEAFKTVIDSTDLYLHVGDISYADDHILQTPEVYETTWNDFQNDIQPVTSQKFYMTAPGNHEATCFQGNDVKLCKKYSPHLDYTPYRNFSAYLHRFRMPGNETNGTSNMWYSFTYGMAQFIIIDTETDFDRAPAGKGTDLNGGPFSPNGTQKIWFENELIKANRSRKTVPWIIVAGHRPFFGSIPDFSNSSYGQNCPSCQATFAALIYKYDVDFYFCGHVHWYERLFPVDQNGTSTAYDYNYRPGTVYVTSGAGGAPELVQHVRLNGTVKASSGPKHIYGYVKLALKNATRAELSYMDTQSNKLVEKLPIDRRH